MECLDNAEQTRTSGGNFFFLVYASSEENLDHKHVVLPTHKMDFPPFETLTVTTIIFKRRFSDDLNCLIAVSL